MHLILYCFTKLCDGLMVKTLMWNQGDQSSMPLTNIYYVECVCSYIYIVHVCKYIVLKWVVDR
jgi:hypothetical protein